MGGASKIWRALRAQECTITLASSPGPLSISQLLMLHAKSGDEATTTPLFPSEARSLLGLECLRMASGHISRVRLNFLSYSLQRLRPRLRVILRQKLWAPSRWSCKAYKLYGSAGLCLPGKSMFARPKTIAPS